MYYLAIITLINFAILASPLPVKAEKCNSTDKVLITSTAPNPPPIVDNPHLPPKTPSGPLWMPAPCDSSGKVQIVSKTPITSPVVDSPNPPPETPSGPLWMPAQSEKYRHDLEKYRLNLESKRKSSPTNNVSQYLRGVEQYRNGIKLYRENITATPLINQLQQNDNHIP